MPASRKQQYLDALGVRQWRLRHGPAQLEANAGDATVVEQEADVSGDAWPQLEQRVAACTACELHRGRTQTVFGSGSKSARWMIVGEGPGAEEDRRGEPFVGRAGQLLDAMLKAAGFTRESVYIANIVKCRPPSNRDPRSEESAACAGFLQAQIELLRPALILAVGRVAAQNLLSISEPLGEMRGKPFFYENGIKVPVVVTYHPAYLLRSPSAKAQSWQDLRFALDLLDRPSGL